MIRNSLLICCFLLTEILSIYAQVLPPANPVNPPQAPRKKAFSLAQQNSVLASQLRQSAAEKQQLQNQINALQKNILALNDSLARQQIIIQQQLDNVAQADQLRDTLTQQATTLKAAKTQISQLEYDKKILSDRQVVRIYHVPTAEVRQQFIRSLAAPESGFQYDDGLVDDEIQITRNFNSQANSWLVFDKTSDDVLELRIRIKQHLYDPQKTVVFGKTRLLQKTRYSNKPVEEQRDPERTALYQEKLLRMLEGKLNGTSDK